MAQRLETGVAAQDSREGGYFPNKLVRLLLFSLEDVLGSNSLRAVLTLTRLPELAEQALPPNFEPALSFSEVAQLNAAIDEMHGTRSGQQLSLRAGHAVFRHGIKDFGGLLSVADVAFRILPLSFRVRLSMEVLAEILNRYSGQHVRLTETPESYLWIVERCAICWGLQVAAPACSIVTGLLSETLYWASGGRSFQVEEVTCAGLGDPACMFRIGRAPSVTA